MDTSLYINFYIDNNSERQSELEHCLDINTRTFDNIIFVLDPDDLEHLDNLLESFGERFCKYERITIPTRPTFNELFALTELNPKDINVVANSAIERLLRYRD